MTRDPAFVTPPLTIEPRFLDHNGHVNMAYHLVMADRALDFLFAAFKMDPAYGATRGLTTFAAEMHVRYLREIAIGDAIVARTLIVEADAKRVLWAVELVRRPDGAVVTTVEGVSLSIDLATRRVTPFPDDVAARIGAMAAEHAKAPRPDWLGGQVGMRRRAAILNEN